MKSDRLPDITASLYRNTVSGELKIGGEELILHIEGYDLHIAALNILKDKHKMGSSRMCVF